MSNEPAGAAPPPDPYAVPDVPPSAAAGPVPPQDAGAQYGAPQYGAPQYGAPSSPYGAPQYGQPPQAPQYGAPEYGQPPYGTTPYGATPYGTPPYPGYPAGQTPYAYGAPPTEGMAVASLVTSLVGMFALGGLSGPVGLGLGIAALKRIRVSGKSGRGLAIAGIVTGALGTVELLVIIAWLVFVGTFLASLATTDGWSDGQGSDSSSSDGGTDGDTQGTLPDYTLRTDLAVGDCLDVYAYEYDMSDTNPVDCAVPHEGEVVAVIPLSGPVTTDLDADDPAWEAAWESCDAQTEALLPGYSNTGDAYLYYPHPADFTSGSTTAYCAYFAWDDTVTGSAVQHTLQGASATTT